ncbi:hypothetical protein GTPT_1991 [Tatumella ptyseos ATCC 33301]|uniref:Uncharacterized protein n=1 Tax=Tatumella ptyseos ATCC 33301 TaxID=1005995 RepID=A0A085JF08_9GAMM|nr:hypothetical protein GTPT_1991 [Tatumella ptyseos ATCC 33301]
MQTGPAFWRSKSGIVYKLRPPSRWSATRCLQRFAPVKGSTVLTNQALLSGCEAWVCPQAGVAGEKICPYRWRGKEKLFLAVKEFFDHLPL